jgi:hypothetical protein
MVAKPGANIFAAQAKHGADDSEIGLRTNAAQPSGSGATEEAIEDGFRLIVQRVACGDGEGLEREEGIAGATSFLLKIAFGWRFGMDQTGQMELGGESANEGFVFLRFGGAQFMVDVEDDGGQVEFGEGVEEENGIRATRDRDADFSGNSRFVKSRPNVLNQRPF